MRIDPLDPHDLPVVEPLFRILLILRLNCNDKGSLELWVGMGFVSYGLLADISSLNDVPGGEVGSRKQRRANCVQKPYNAVQERL